MIFRPTALDGAWLIELEPNEDRRGFFARSFDAREFEARGLRGTVAQCNVSHNRRRGTLRGLHLQLPPAAETKLVRCTRGAIHDVIVDLRPGSATYLRHYGVELSAANRRQLYVPELFAHGFLTLDDDTEVSYQTGEFYTPGQEAGLRWDDPALGIRWPAAVEVLSDKDAAWPLLPADAQERNT
jgi:dTDP-4-dehydrorhamnose 3,5-epimerase